MEIQLPNSTSDLFMIVVIVGTKYSCMSDNKENWKKKKILYCQFVPQS